MARFGQSAVGLAISIANSLVCALLGAEANPPTSTEESKTGREGLRSCDQTLVWQASVAGVVLGQGARTPLATAGAFAGQGPKLSLNSGKVQDPFRQGGRW